jgi:hypothetical protein
MCCANGDLEKIGAIGLQILYNGPVDSPRSKLFSYLNYFVKCLVTEYINDFIFMWCSLTVLSNI